VTDGISYFYAEVKCLKALLAALAYDHPYPVFYFIDEIFRGTNNRERLAGSRAYIQTLAGKPGVGLLSTHDLELIHLADEVKAVKNYHFRDDIKNGRMVFDFKLHRGPSPTTNALKIMEMEGLPVSPPT
jgi:DNA mismatch repair ATPase MutS